MPARRLTTCLAALATIGLLAAGCASDGSAGSPDAPGTASGFGTAPPADRTDAVPAAFDVQAALVGGGEYDLAELAGRPVVLWFWAPF